MFFVEKYINFMWNIKLWYLELRIVCVLKIEIDKNNGFVII